MKITIRDNGSIWTEDVNTAEEALAVMETSPTNSSYCEVEFENGYSFRFWQFEDDDETPERKHDLLLEISEETGLEY